MSPKEAKRILELLLQGVDPETGEVLSRDGVLNTPEVIRALFLAARALDSQPTESRIAAHMPPHAGKPWTREEEERLIAEFDAGSPIEELARSHGRSKGGIAARLVRLGRIGERSEVYVRESRAHEVPSDGESDDPESAT